MYTHSGEERLGEVSEKWECRFQAERGEEGLADGGEGGWESNILEPGGGPVWGGTEDLWRAKAAEAGL